MTRIIKKISVLLVMFAMMTSMLNIATVNVEASSNTKDFIVSEGVYGEDYSYANNTLTILSSTELIISGTTTTDKIVVASGIEANLILSDLTIDLSSNIEGLAGVYCPINLSGAGTSTITIIGVNNLFAGYEGAGIYVPKSNLFTIQGEGELNVAGGKYWPGIGRNGNGNILITSGIINSIGGVYGAGIGSSCGFSAGVIEITGGTIYAKGGTYSAGIGGAALGTGGAVTITGGNITAIAGTSSYGIGMGYQEEAVSPNDYASFSTGENGTAIITTNSIEDTSNKDSWSCILNMDSTYTVYGDFILMEDLTIPSNESLTINDGATLTTNEGVTITLGNGSIVEANKTDDGDGTTITIDGISFDFPNGVTLLGDGTIKLTGEQTLVTTVGGDEVIISPTDSNGSTIVTIRNGQIVLTIGATITYDGNSLDVPLNEMPFTPDANFIVTFDTMNGEETTTTVANGKHATKPTDPVYEGYVFNGWYKDVELTTVWDFDLEFISKDTTIYADWIKLSEYETIEGNNQEITYGENETITFTIDADANEFVGLYLNDSLVDESMYSVVSGSTIITLNKEFVETLTANEYTFLVEYTYGYAYVTLTVLETEVDADSDDEDDTELEDDTLLDDEEDLELDEDTTLDDSDDEDDMVLDNKDDTVLDDKDDTEEVTPDTGDTTNTTILVLLMLLSLIAGLFVYFKNKKK